MFASPRCRTIEIDGSSNKKPDIRPAPSRQIHERSIHVEPDAQAGVRPPHHFSEALGEQAEHRLRKKNIGEPCSDRHGLVDRDLGAPATRAPTEETCTQLNAFLDGKRDSLPLGHATGG
jgi:hypothetical protein